MRTVCCEDCDNEVTLEQEECYCPECGAYLFDAEPDREQDFSIEDYFEE